MNLKQALLLATVSLSIAVQVGCAPSSGSDAAEANSSLLPDTSKTDPSVSTPNTGATKDVLLFSGVGVSTSDWQTTEKIIKDMGLSYSVVNSAGLDAMSLGDMEKYRMILVPGGYARTITSGLKGATRVRVRQAVRDGGVAYLGICAGAFVAVEAGAETDNVTSYGFPVVEGAHLPMWYPEGNTSAVADVVPVTFANGTSRHLVWYGGPSTPEWAGGVVARYANGKAAVSQTWFHKGFVTVSGPHPEAPQGWRNTAGNDPDGLDYEIMKQLVTSTLTRTRMASY